MTSVMYPSSKASYGESIIQSACSFSFRTDRHTPTSPLVNMCDGVNRDVSVISRIESVLQFGTQQMITFTNCLDMYTNNVEPSTHARTPS